MITEMPGPIEEPPLEEAVRACELLRDYFVIAPGVLTRNSRSRLQQTLSRAALAAALTPLFTDQETEFRRVVKQHVLPHIRLSRGARDTMKDQLERLRGTLRNFSEDKAQQLFEAARCPIADPGRSGTNHHWTRNGVCEKCGVGVDG